MINNTTYVHNAKKLPLIKKDKVGDGRKTIRIRQTTQ